MFSKEQCERIVSLLHDRREHWEPRGFHEYGSLHTVGAVSAFGDREKYEATAKEANKVLWSELSEEYEQLRVWTENMSGCRVKYDKRLALPGFQIFTNIKSGGDRLGHGGIVHRDYLWDSREIKDITGIRTVDDEYSATIMLSKGSHSLDTWTDFPEGRRTITYKKGVPTLHDHQLMHQVPYIGEAGDRRYSMQIRGFRVGNKITLYL